ncbi:MAG: carbohydrate kinase [Caldilineaceae bacterium]|nr:carbohydrate kinase [Caldilineaceae bacterium]HRJ43470.1 PfkB family carbohydrate kinase [Caldilineaceae bacterium]
MTSDFDVLCVGFACYDLTFSIDHHLGPDEKGRATGLIGCGGGLAANAAVTAARLGYRTAFAGYLGNDLYGDAHLAEFQESAVDTSLVLRGDPPTSLSAILVKPDGARTLVNYREELPQLGASAVDLAESPVGALLFDGHQQKLAISLIAQARRMGIPTVLDADSVNDGTTALMGLVEFLVTSERFGQQFTGCEDALDAAISLDSYAPTVVVTAGERGLAWHSRADSRFGPGQGWFPPFVVEVIDTTGAGDAFHGAFAAGLSAGMGWEEVLRYASAVGALCCAKNGARIGIPTGGEVAAFLRGKM